MKIVCVEPLGMSNDDAERIKQYFDSKGMEFEFYNNRVENERELILRMQNAVAVIVSNIKLGSEILSHCKKLRLISVAFTGVDHIDMNYCRNNRIMVCNASGYSNVAVSELVIGLMIDVLRKISELNCNIRKLEDRRGYLGSEIYKKNVGIIGTGNIGGRCAKILSSFECNLYAYNRSHKKELIDVGVEYLELDTLLRVCDIITIHLPLNKDTYHFIGKEEIAKMKNNAVLINCARGDIIDNEALADALLNGKIAGAGIDVFDIEPPLTPNNTLFYVPNCILTPHIGYATHEAFRDRMYIVIDNVLSWVNGTPKNVCL